MHEVGPYPNLLHGLHRLLLDQFDVESRGQDEDEHSSSRSTYRKKDVCHFSPFTQVVLFSRRWCDNLPMNPKMSLMVGTKMTRALVPASRTMVMMMWRIQLKSLEAHSRWLTEVRI